jgi:hypothetical protein
VPYPLTTHLSFGFFMDIYFLFRFSPFILLIVIFLIFTSIFRSIYMLTKNIIPIEVLSFPLSLCTTDEFVEIQSKVKTFTEALFKGDMLVELTLNEHELNCLANKGKVLELYPTKTRHYKHYKLESNLILFESLTYPFPLSFKGFTTTTRSINISMESGKLNGIITSISQNGWKFRFGKTSYKFNGGSLFHDIFYINGVAELDDIVSRIDSMRVQDNSIRFVSKLITTL